MTGSNSTIPAVGEPSLGKPQFASHEWLEPIVCCFAAQPSIDIEY